MNQAFTRRTSGQRGIGGRAPRVVRVGLPVVAFSVVASVARNAEATIVTTTTTITTTTTTTTTTTVTARATTTSRTSAATTATAKTTTTTTTTSPTTRTSGPSTTGASVYWGAYLGGQFTGAQPPWDWSAQSAFQTADAAGKAASLLPFGAPFYSWQWCGGFCTFPPDVFEKVRENGLIPWFTWQTTDDYSDAQIAAGAEDGYITAWAQAAKAWGHPFFLRFDWEMDGNWFPWGVGVNGNTPISYVAMWRHVHDIFTSVGATNATWVWCPDIWTPGVTYRPLINLYPGNSYVDWTCLDGYNGDAPWTGFQNLFASDYATITSSIAPGKPMAIGETASTEAGGSKASWIRDMLSHLTSYFPKVHAVVWYDITDLGPGGRSDWPIESSMSSRSAFAAGISSSVYASNAYATLSGSPIAPPQ